VSKKSTETVTSRDVSRLNSYIDAVTLALESAHMWSQWSDVTGETEPLARFYQVGAVVYETPLLPLERLQSLFDTAGVAWELWDAETARQRCAELDPDDSARRHRSIRLPSSLTPMESWHAYGLRRAASSTIHNSPRGISQMPHAVSVRLSVSVRRSSASPGTGAYAKSFWRQGNVWQPRSSSTAQARGRRRLSRWPASPMKWVCVQDHCARRYM
jgi:hypothetical protein